RSSGAPRRSRRAARRRRARRNEDGTGDRDRIAGGAGRTVKNAKGSAAGTARSAPFERRYPDDRSRVAGSLARLDVINRPGLLRERHAKNPRSRDGTPPTLKFQHFSPRLA